MPNLEVFAEVDPAVWNEDVKRLKSCCFHCHQWSIFSSESNNARPLYFRWKEVEGETRALGFGLVSEKRVAGSAIYQALSFGSLPAHEDNESLNIMMKEILSYARQTGVTSLSFNSFGTPAGTEIFHELGFPVERRWEFLVDIEASEEDLWKRVHSKKRNLIRKGQKAGVQVKVVDGMEDIEQFRNLAVETWERKRRQGINFPEVSGENYYRLLKDKLIRNGLGRLYMAYDGDRPVAGAFFAAYDNMAYYMLSAANEHGFKKAAPDLLLWSAITEYRAAGYKIFNLGGLSENELDGKPLETSGLYHFKKRFSAEAYPCYRGNLILKPNQYKMYMFMKRIKNRLFHT